MRAALAAALALAAGCVTVEYEHERALAPLADARVAALHVGESSLGACLDTLGAPLYVWEDKHDGLALGYAWRDARQWAAGVRLNVVRGMSASFNYRDMDAHMPGYVLFFDSAWRLSAVRKGDLRDLALDIGPQRPAHVE